jgi:carboxymethylenebutenolidase
MWNQYQTDEYQGMLAETISYPGYNGDSIHAYYSRPLGGGPFPGVILLPHMPGWDEFYREATRRFSQHGYAALCPDIYCRFGHGTPEEISVKARNSGGVPDESVMGDCEGAVKFLKSQPYSNKKVGVIGTCSGGRQSFMAACQVQGIDAAVDCWGGRVIAPKETLTPGQPVAPVDFIKNLSCPLLGIFGNEDKFPTPEEVNQLEVELKKFKKNYQFHRYDSAGHGFWYYHTEMYRPKQAMDSWGKVFEFFGKYLH